ncbi:ABC transporter substrate-binding protein [candidate division KSB1 bacterium]|nr:ABC transporter substrate-binding protein [candidate division KSB1 bacterium]
MKRLIIIIVTVVLGVTFLTSCARKPEKVKIGYQKTEIYQHFFTAVERGFFKAEGVEVEPVEFASANLMAEALIAGRIDGTATSAFPVIFSVEQNNPGQFKIYIVNVITETAFPDYILVKKDSKMNSLSELKGKKIGTYPGSTILTYTKIILKHFMNPDEDITIVQLKPVLQLQALETGQVDAIFALEPIASVGIVRGIARVLEEAPVAKYVMESLPGSGSTFSSRFLKNYPKAAEKVKRAMYRALDFLNDPKNIEEARSILGEWTEIDPEVIERLRPLKYWKLEDIDRGAVQKLADLLFEWGALEKKIDTSNLYYGQ